MSERCVDELFEEKYCGQTVCSACGEVVRFDPEEEDGYDAMLKHKMFCPKWTIYDDEEIFHGCGCVDGE